MSRFVRDLLTRLRVERGSVMMEFIIVMPIYLVLFGGTCAIGDILVHSGRLLSADRFSAFFADRKDISRKNVREWVKTMFRQPPKRAGEKYGDYERTADWNERNILTIDSDWHYADATAPWTVCAAAKTTDSLYVGAGSGIAQLVVGKHWIETGTGKTDAGDFWSDFARNGWKTLFSRPGADVDNYRFSYYILKRKKYFSNSGSRKQSWREVPESSLMKIQRQGRSAWDCDVYDEGWFKAESIGDNGIKSAKDCPEAGRSACWYTRYRTFVTWSN